MFKLRLLFTLSLITIAIRAQDTSFCSELKSIREIVATSHYQPKTENDSLSRGVFWLFLEQLDEDKHFFLDKDIEVFKNDEFYLDNYFNKGYNRTNSDLNTKRQKVINTLNNTNQNFLGKHIPND